MESRGETSELQQLVSSDADGDNDNSIHEVKVTSPGRSNKVSAPAPPFTPSQSNRPDRFRPRATPATAP